MNSHHKSTVLSPSDKLTQELCFAFLNNVWQANSICAQARGQRLNLFRLCFLPNSVGKKAVYVDISFTFILQMCHVYDSVSKEVLCFKAGWHIKGVCAEAWGQSIFHKEYVCLENLS